MELSRSGGPAYPTLSGAPIDDTTFRFEGMTLWDFYVGQALAGGRHYQDATDQATMIINVRKEILNEQPRQDNDTV